MTNDLEHPSITALRRNGVPVKTSLAVVYCDECGCEIDGDVYQDQYHDSLCLECLKFLCKKGD